VLIVFIGCHPVEMQSAARIMMIRGVHLIRGVVICQIQLSYQYRLYWQTGSKCFDEITEALSALSEMLQGHRCFLGFTCVNAHFVEHKHILSVASQDSNTNKGYLCY